MNEINRKVDNSSLIGGVLLIVLGGLLLLAQLHFLEFDDIVRRYWPMILVMIGFPMLFNRRKLWSGLWLITLGFWLQISHLRLFGLSYRTSWPLLLIALGAGITVRALVDTAAPKERSHD